MSAPGSEAVSFRKYEVEPYCGGCGRKLVKAHEPAMWFHGYPPPTAVFGECCWSLAASAHLPKENAA